MVVDPPRGGLGDRVAHLLADAGAPRITYVSCDPATLARDLIPLQSAGYRVDPGSPGRLISPDLPSGNRPALAPLTIAGRRKADLLRGDSRPRLSAEQSPQALLAVTI